MCAKNSRVALCLGNGKIMKTGQRSHHREILRGVVRWIILSLKMVYVVQMPTLAPHSAGLCISVSISPWISVGMMLILCSLTFVGTRWWITTYHTQLTVSVTPAGLTSLTQSARWSTVTRSWFSHSGTQASCLRGPSTCQIHAFLQYSHLLGRNIRPHMIVGSQLFQSPRCALAQGFAMTGESPQLLTI